MIVIFEGVDKSGKTSIMAEFNRLTNFKYLTVDRLWVSQIGYAMKYKRPVSIVSISKTIPDTKVYIVYVTAKDSVIQKRIIKARHPHVDVHKDKTFLRAALSMFVHYPNITILEYDTSFTEPTQIASQIIKEIYNEKVPSETKV